MVEKTVIIIGAGVGGIYTAAKLAKFGYNVTLVEKNQKPGGRCNSFQKDGYSFDTGPTMLLMSEIYARAFFDLGVDLKNHLELIRIEPNYDIFFQDGTHLTLTSNKQRMREQLETIEPNSYGALQNYLQKGEFYYNRSMVNLIDRDFRNFF